MELNDVAVKAENAALEKFPERILFLNDLLESQEFQFTESDLKFTSNPTNTMMNQENSTNDSEDKTPEEWENFSVKDFTSCNQKIIDAIGILKPHVKQLIDDANSLKIWVLLMVPKAECGNNFGVSVQELTLGYIYDIQNNAIIYYKKLTTFHDYRAEIVKKFIKYPMVEDYRRLLEEYDFKQYWTLTNVLREIRNSYSVLYDILIKNMDKIKNPRTSNTDNLY